MRTTLRVETINQAVIRTAAEIRHRDSRSFQWTDLTEQDLWQELACCILGSRARFEIALAASKRLQAKGLLDAPIRSRFSAYERELRYQLALPFPAGPRTTDRHYPYPSTRANWLRRSAEAVYGSGGSIRDLLSHSGNAVQTRSSLVRCVLGIGPKQASLFLQNTGFATDLAVLDSHVLNYLALNELIRPDVSVRTLNQYEPIEDIFRSHARQLGLSVGSLDLGVWVVMRVLGMET